MMLLLDFAEARVNRRGGKKPHGNHSNNNTDRGGKHNAPVNGTLTDR